MRTSFEEEEYPSHFRELISAQIAEQLNLRYSIELVGMKRVGINSFLRFFLFHKHIQKKYLAAYAEHLFVLVDLNDLIECELFSFWRLTLKRINDVVQSSGATLEIKEKISAIFSTCIQSGDFFLTYDGVKEALVYITMNGYAPTLVFSRFDRLKNVISLELFHNFQSLLDATNQKLAYIFTSDRDLSAISASVFDKKVLATFSKVVYIKPAAITDQKIILHTFLQKYHIAPDEELENTIMEAAGGHTQYLHVACIVLQELLQKEKIITREVLRASLEKDERVLFLSEEIWESLQPEEQTTLQKIVSGNVITKVEKEKGKYLWDTGIVREEHSIRSKLFSPLFVLFIENCEREKDTISIDLSRKEHIVFSLLEKNISDICTRDVIIATVWPEYKEYGVSDWSIDRLIARVRGKLKKQKSQYEIITIRTRGYKLVPIDSFH